MSEESRIKRWRDAKREHGLKAVTIWLTSDEELLLKDLALQWHCSPSAVVQQALAKVTPPAAPDISRATEIPLLRQLIREELTAMQAPPPSVAVGPTVTPTEIQTPAAIPETPSYDQTKFTLGPLCEKRHDVDGQGHSLRQIGGKHECVTCGNARKLAYKQRQRGAKKGTLRNIE
jgi:hypothetical protein